MIVTSKLKVEQDNLVLFTADGRHNPRDVGRLLLALERGHDMAVASRFIVGGERKRPDQMSRYRSIGNRLFTLLANLFFYGNLSDCLSQLRAVKRSKLMALGISGSGLPLHYCLSIRAMKKGWRVAAEFFGLPIGRVVALKLEKRSVIAVLETAQARGLRCLYFEADPNDLGTVATVEEHGFHLVDVRVVLEHPFDNRPAPVPRYPIAPELLVGPPYQDEMSRLQDIAAQIGRTSRFDFDQNFGQAQSERLYRLWIEKACQGFADVVLVARWQQAGAAVGLITCTLRNEIANIQLAGVHLDHRKRSVGTGLVQAALDWARSQQAQVMQVVTQARNVPAQRLYQQMGFFTRSMTLYYHKWL